MSTMYINLLVGTGALAISVKDIAIAAIVVSVIGLVIGILLAFMMRLLKLWVKQLQRQIVKLRL